MPPAPREKDLLEPPFKAATRLLGCLCERDATRLDADKLAGSLWHTHRAALIACIEGERRRLRPAGIGLLAALVTASPVVARELLQDLEQGGARLERGLREAEASGSTLQQTASMALALIRTRERSILLRLLHGEHKRLASAPLRLLPKLPAAMQAHVLVVFRNHVLLASGLPLRARLAPCLSTLESVVELYTARGVAADAAHAHLLIVLTSLVPTSVAGRALHTAQVTLPAAAGLATETEPTAADGDNSGGTAGAASTALTSSSRSGAEDAVLRALLAMRPAADGRQQRLVLATLHALPSIRSAYVRLRAGSSSAMEPRASRVWLAQLVFACQLSRVTLGGPDERQQHVVEREALAASIVADGPSGVSSALPAIHPLRADAALELAHQPPTDAVGAAAMVDGVLPGALSRPFWTKALLHSSVLVRLSAANALLLLLPLLCRFTAPLAAVASAPHESPEGSAATGSRLIAAELQRRLPDVQILLKLRGAVADSRGEGAKLAHLLEARMLEALRAYVILLPTTAADAFSHAEKLLRISAPSLAPISRYHALLLLRERAHVEPHGGECNGGNGTAREITHIEDGGHGRGASSLAVLKTASDTSTLPAAADLAAMLRLALSRQPCVLRPPMWKYLSDQLKRCGALHLASVHEQRAWLQSLLAEHDADTLAALLHLCLASLHANVDRASELTAQVAGGEDHTPSAPHPSGAVQLPTGGGSLRLSPLAMCALAQLRFLAASSTDASLRALDYLCRALGMIGAEYAPCARLLHAGLQQYGVADGVALSQSTVAPPATKKMKHRTGAATRAVSSPMSGWGRCAQLITLVEGGGASDVVDARQDSVEKRGVKRNSREQRLTAATASPESRGDRLRGQSLDSVAASNDIEALNAWDQVLRGAPRYDGAALACLLVDHAKLRSTLADQLHAIATDESPLTLVPSLPLLGAYIRSHFLTSPAPQAAIEDLGGVWLAPLAHICVARDGGRMVAEVELALARDLFCALVRVWSPPPSVTLPLMSALRDAASSSLHLGFGVDHPRHVQSCIAAAALCSLLCASNDAATPDNVQSTVSVGLRLLLPGSAEERARGGIGARKDVGDSPAARALCAALRRLLLHRPPSFGSESLVVLSRDLMRFAATSPMISVARALLRVGAGRSMTALLPTLQRHILAENSLLRRVRSRPVDATSSLAAVACELLTLLCELASACPVAIPSENLCTLLQASTCAPPRMRRLISVLLATHIAGGMPLAALDAANAAEFASHALNVSVRSSDGGGALANTATDDIEEEHVDDAGSLMMHEAIALQWIRAEELVAMAENFPPDLLQPLPPQTLIERMRVAEEDTASLLTSPQHVGEREAQPLRGASTSIAYYSSSCDVLGTLLALQSFLSAAAVDSRQWIERGGVGLCVMALCAPSETVRRLGYDCLGRLMSTLEDGPSFAERRQAGRILISLRDAVTSANMQIPRATAAFVAHGLRVLLRPLHPQYKPLNSYVVGRPYFNLDEVPMLFDAFHGGGARAREERIWILQLLGRAICSASDLAMLQRRHILQLVMSLHDSMLADAPTRRACVAVLVAAARIQEGATTLLLELGLAGWVSAACTRLAMASGSTTAASSSCVPFAGLMLQMLSAAHDNASKVSVPAAILCGRALDCIWRSAGASGSSASPADAVLAGTCARALLVLLRLHEPGPSPWRCIDLNLVQGLLTASARAPPTRLRLDVLRPALLDASDADADSARADGDWALALLGEMDSCDVTPQDGDPQCALSVARVAAEVLAQHADAHGTRRQPLHAQAKALCGFMAWRARCCEASAAFRAASSDPKLRTIVGTWAERAELREIAAFRDDASVWMHKLEAAFVR